MKLLRLEALVKKETLQIIRDPSSILISIVLPILLLFLYGSGVSLDMNHLRIGLVMEDTSPDAQSFAETLTQSRYFEVKVVRNRLELVDEITRGSIRGFVVIPSYFSEFRKRPDLIAPLQVIADGSEPNTAVFVQNYVQSALGIWLEQETINKDLKGFSGINVQPRFWYNEQLESRFFLLSGSLALIMTLIGTLLTALVIAREWERGTMEALISTPVTVSEIIWGKVIPYFILGMISMAICIFTSVVIYGLPLRGSLWALMLASAVFLYCALGLGLMISTLSKNQVFASQIAVVTGFLPSYVLSGFLFEISSMPNWIQAITYFNPARYFVQSLQTLFLVGNVYSLVFKNMVPIILIGSIFFSITAYKTVKRLS